MNRRQRRAQLVARRGDELALHAIDVRLGRDVGIREDAADAAVHGRGAREALQHAAAGLEHDELVGVRGRRVGEVRVEALPVRVRLGAPVAQVGHQRRWRALRELFVRESKQLAAPRVRRDHVPRGVVEQQAVPGRVEDGVEPVAALRGVGLRGRGRAEPREPARRLEGGQHQERHRRRAMSQGWGSRLMAQASSTADATARRTMEPQREDRMRLDALLDGPVQLGNQRRRVERLPHVAARRLPRERPTPRRVRSSR